MKRVGVFAAAALLAGALLAGCGSNQKIAVRVNNDSVTEDEFYKRAANVDAINLAPALQGRGLTRAGEYALSSLIIERLVMQLAAEKKATPTDAQINGYLAFAKQYPQTSGMEYDPFRTEDDWRRDTRIAVAYRNLIMQSVTPTQADLQGVYDRIRPQLKKPDQYHLRVIENTTPAKAQESLDALKKGVPFETVALTKSEDKQSAARSGDIGTVQDQDPRLSPQMLQAVKSLKPGQYTQTPVKAAPPSASATPGVQPPTHYLIIQLVDAIPGHTPTFDEVRPLLENVAISQKDPGAFQRVRNMIQERQQKADLQVNLKQYQDLVKKLQQPAPMPMVPGPAAGGPAPAPMPTTPVTPPPGK